MKQRLQLKLKENKNANLYFSGTEFQLVFLSGEDVQAHVQIYVREGSRTKTPGQNPPCQKPPGQKPLRQNILFRNTGKN